MWLKHEVWPKLRQKLIAARQVQFETNIQYVRNQQIKNARTSDTSVTSELSCMSTDNKHDKHDKNGNITFNNSLLQMPQFHFYGAYPQQEHYSLSDPENGFLFKGMAANVHDSLSQYRVMLAPLRFGAGTKGKILDAFMNGVPVVTTSVGAEGMSFDEGYSDFGGKVSDQVDEIVDHALKLYSNECEWVEAKDKARTVVDVHFNFDKSLLRFDELLRQHDASADTSTPRSVDWLQRLLWTGAMRSDEYKSKYITAMVDLKAAKKQVMNQQQLAQQQRDQ
jgi:glycosyltransferase involved in cell wall biosynthesis